MARIQPFCRENIINFGFFNGERNFPRTVTERNKALRLYNNHFCLKWKSEGVSFNQAIKDLKKNNFKVVDKFNTEENINFRFEYIFTPKKIESHFTIFIRYGLETRNTDRTCPYVFCFYRLSKLAGRFNRDLKPYELEKYKNGSIVLDGDNCVTNALDFCLKLKGAERKG